MRFPNFPPVQLFARPKAVQIQPRAVVDSAVSVNVEQAKIIIADAIYPGGPASLNAVLSALDSFEGRPVELAINSPGGDFFEGLAIYNALRGYAGEIVVRVLGVAASAASIVAMGGDRIEIGRHSSLMIHKCWGLVIGNESDMTEAAKFFASVDSTCADLYGRRTGMDHAEVLKLMSAETWMTGTEAIALGFVDGLLPADEAEPEPKAFASTAAPASKNHFADQLRTIGLSKAQAARAAATAWPAISGEPADDLDLERIAGVLFQAHRELSKNPWRS